MYSLLISFARFAASPGFQNADLLHVLLFLGKLACKMYKELRREASAVKIQKNLRRYIAHKSYLEQRSSAIKLQTGLRGMVARNEFRFRKQTKASTTIQVSHE